MSANPWSYAADRFDPPRWEPTGRAPLLPHQHPPDGTDWNLWILFGGRGAGKTEGCARYFAQWMREHPGHRGRIIGPTLGDVIESCVRGPSGLLSVDPDVVFLPSAPGGSIVKWPNGSEALLLGTHSPADVERFRAGGNRHIDWWEELAACRNLAEAWDQAELGLRLGDRPHSIASTTPKPRPKLKELLKEPGTAVTHGTIDDNPHLDPNWKARVKARYEGTRTGRQELGGELLETIEGALWRPDLIVHQDMPDRSWLTKVVVALDPADGDDAGDEQAYAIAGRGIDGRAYLLEVLGQRTSPTRWLHSAFDAADRWDANYLLVEKNHGGAFLTTTVETVREGRKRDGKPWHAVRTVTARHAKRLRAEPVADLYEQERVVHCVEDGQLEDQLTSWVPDSGQPSPDRLDALVYAVTDLLVGAQGVPLNPDDHRATGRKTPQREAVTGPQDDSRRIDRRRKPTSRIPQW